MIYLDCPAFTTKAEGFRTSPRLSISWSSGRHSETLKNSEKVFREQAAAAVAALLENLLHACQVLRCSWLPLIHTLILHSWVQQDQQDEQDSTSRFRQRISSFAVSVWCCMWLSVTCLHRLHPFAAIWWQKTNPEPFKDESSRSAKKEWQRGGLIIHWQLSV